MTISTEVPGIAEKDIDVSITAETLVVRGEKKSEHDEEARRRKTDIKSR